MKVCSYIVTHSTGLAPNPFHGVCTLAVCTPNHMRADLSHGDWIVGLASKNLRDICQHQDGQSGPRMIYVMEIDQVMGLDAYYRAFPMKRAKRDGSAIERAGDAIYYLENGKLVHSPESEDHDSEEAIAQDIKGDRVFIGTEFWHFGKHSPVLPVDSWATKIVSRFENTAIGLRYLEIDADRTDGWTEQEYAAFRQWLPAQGGLIGDPITLESAPQSGCASCS